MGLPPGTARLTPKRQARIAMNFALGPPCLCRTSLVVVAKVYFSKFLSEYLAGRAFRVRLRMGWHGRTEATRKHYNRICISDHLACA